MRRYGVLDGRIFYIDRDGSAKWEEPIYSTAPGAPVKYGASFVGPAMAPIGAGVDGSRLGRSGAAFGAGMADMAQQILAAQLAGERMSIGQRAFHAGMEGAAAVLDGTLGTCLRR
jgi:hypothetical protein